MKQIQQTLDSREVAEMVGKKHKNLLADIRGYVEELGELKIQPSDFFTESTYKTAQNRTMPCYKVTKKGCEFIAHKLTGIKGTEFTAKYINRFHEMEDIISENTSGKNMVSVVPQIPDKVIAYNKGFILGVFRAEIETGNISMEQIYDMLSPNAKKIVMDTLLGIGGIFA